MTTRFSFITGLLIFLGCLSPAIAGTDVEIKAIRPLETPAPPVDTALSLDGRLFVLDRKGTVYVYGSDGNLDHEIATGIPADRISVSIDGQTLILSDSAAGRVTRVRLAFIRDIDIEGSPFKGPEDAPIVVVVFTDFQCAGCADASQLLEEVLDAYPEQVKLVLKNFPLPRHDFSKQAAAAALAAGNQGKYWYMHDLLFDSFAGLDDAKIRELAEILRLDMETFDKDRENPDTLKRIQKDMKDGRDAGVFGTPAIFVNGQMVRKRDLEGFKFVIDEKLSQKAP